MNFKSNNYYKNVIVNIYNCYYYVKVVLHFWKLGRYYVFYKSLNPIIIIYNYILYTSLPYILLIFEDFNKQFTHT